MPLFQHVLLLQFPGQKVLVRHPISENDIDNNTESRRYENTTYVLYVHLDGLSHRKSHAEWLILTKSLVDR